MPRNSHSKYFLLTSINGHYSYYLKNSECSMIVLYRYRILRISLLFMMTILKAKWLVET